jgi:hypothetical protein
MSTELKIAGGETGIEGGFLEGGVLEGGKKGHSKKSPRKHSKSPHSKSPKSRSPRKAHAYNNYVRKMWKQNEAKFSKMGAQEAMKAIAKMWRARK